jgi:PHD/YefM family antitoxin component YafN of YafNO toxin-antitoxin module
MAEAALVEIDIEAGRELVRLLDDAGFPVTGAAWIHDSDMDEWRLVIRTPKAAQNLLEALREVRQVMDAKGDLRHRLDLARVKLVPPNDRLLQVMERMVHVSGVSTVRFSRNVVEGMYIGDAVIYRLAA